MRHRFRRTVLRPALLVLPVAVLTACSVSGEPFADEACEETAALLQTEERGREAVERGLADAAAWADRAADVDGSFDELRDALIEVRDAVWAGDDLGETAEQSADEALARVAERCDELGHPVEADGLSPSETGVRGLVTR